VLSIRDFSSIAGYPDKDKSVLVIPMVEESKRRKGVKT
jgi:hypothetical protein